MRIDPSVDTISIIKQYELPQEFPDEVVREAETASALMEEPGERLDLRDKLIITIDRAHKVFPCDMYGAKQTAKPVSGCITLNVDDEPIYLVIAE